MGGELCLDPRQSRILERQNEGVFQTRRLGKEEKPSNPSGSCRLVMYQQRSAGLRKDAEPRVNKPSPGRFERRRGSRESGEDLALRRLPLFPRNLRHCVSDHANGRMYPASRVSNRCARMTKNGRRAWPPLASTCRRVPMRWGRGRRTHPERSYRR